MKHTKSLGEVLAHAGDEEEVYTSDQIRRLKRAKRGRFSKTKGLFDFIYLIRSWDKIVGELMAKNTIPHKIMRSTLIVMTKHSIFAQELSFMGPQIIQKIEENIPELKGKIQKIKFSHANFSWDEFKSSQFKKVSKGTSRPKLHPHSPQYKLKMKRAQEVFNDIEDDEVKELLTSLFMDKI